MYDGENLNTGETAETREETGWMKAEGRKVGRWHGWTWLDRDGGRGRKKEAQEKGRGRGIEAKGAGQQPAERPDGAAQGKAWPPSPAASEGSRCFQGARGGSLLTRAQRSPEERPSPCPAGSRSLLSVLLQAPPAPQGSWWSQKPPHLTREKRSGGECVQCVCGCASRQEARGGAMTRGRWAGRRPSCPLVPTGSVLRLLAASDFPFTQSTRLPRPRSAGRAGVHPGFWARRTLGLPCPYSLLLPLTVTFLPLLRDEGSIYMVSHPHPGPSATQQSPGWEGRSE